MVDVVGLRFVTTGEAEALKALDDYERGLLSLNQVKDKHVAAMNRALSRRDADARRAYQNMLRYQREQENASAREARAEEAAQTAAARAVAQRDAEARRAYQNMLRYQREKEAAAAREARAEEAAQAAAARALDQTSQSYARLRASINPTIAAQMQMRQAHATVRAALEAEIITRDEAARTLREYRTAMQQGTVTTQIGARGMNATGMAVQQLGYQVGDFLVQWQSGTNVLVAFGQQATQLVGILPLMGAGFMGLSTGALVALSAGLGIAIPLVTALGAVFMRTRQQAEQAGSAFDGVRAALESIDAARIDTITSGLAEGARAAATEWASLLSVMREVAQEDLRQQMQRITQESVDALVRAQTKINLAQRIGGTPPEVSVLGFSDLSRATEALQLLRSITGETREELAESVRMTELWLRGSGLLTAEVKQLLAQYAAAVGVQAVIKDDVQQTADRTAEYNSRVARTRDLMREIRAETVTVTEDTIRHTTAMGGTVEEAIRLQAALDDGRVSAAGLAGVDIAGALSPAVARAMELAQQLRISFRLAAAMSGAIVQGPDPVEFDPRSPRYDPEAAQRAARIARTRAIMESGDLYAATKAPRAAAASRGGGRGGGGGASAEIISLEAVQQQLAAEARQRRELVQLSEEQRLVKQAELDLIAKLGDSSKRYTEQQLQSGAQIIAQERAKLAEAENFARAQERFTQTMSSAFDGLITGGKKFSDVLQSLARHLESRGWEMLFNGMGSRGRSGGGGLLGGISRIFAGFFDSGGMIPAGQIGIAGENGPEFVRGPAYVTSRADTARMMRSAANSNSGAPARVDVVLHTPEGVTVQEVTQIAGNIAVRVMSAGARRQQKNLPGSLSQIEERGLAQ